MSDLAEYDELSTSMDKYRSALESVGRTEIAGKVADICDNVEAWALANPVTQTTTAPRITRKRWAIPAALCAAGLAVIFALSINKEPTLHTYKTSRAERVTLQLPDGSRVIMAPETELRYSESGNGSRIIDLQGQAYFTVNHDASRSFIVRTNKVITRVLGTSFAVRAYSTDKIAQVAVAEGKVAIGEKTPGTVLLVGDVGRIESGKEPVITRNATIADVFGWMRGQLSFTDVSLGEVAIELERVYDINIQFAGSTLASRPVTIAFTGKSAETMLKILSLALDIEYQRDGRTVVFMEKQK